MKVSIKNFDVAMEIKNNGIELDVYDNTGHLGDLVVTKAKLVWCEGKTSVKKGKAIKWEDFIKYMNQL